MIVIGIDDTDVRGSPGTNQLARRIADRLPPGFTARAVVRHQLLFDPAIPYTTRNGSASIGVEAAPGHDAAELLPLLRAEILAFAPPGSDPGLCVAPCVPAAVLEFGARCKTQPVELDAAVSLAREHGILLKGLGGTNGGMIGALAAVGLFASGMDGRVVHMPGWPWPDDAFGGPRTIAAILARGIDEVRVADTGEPLADGVVDVGKRPRPAWRGGRVVLFVEPRDGQSYMAQRAP